ncbi:MAG: hypothetical protein F6K42_26230 [Leptolyngbya sp. SIO1D8]|nr:hypothetical protein [Leptolyngbya sp. SIO1D8]
MLSHFPYPITGNTKHNGITGSFLLYAFSLLFLCSIALIALAKPELNPGDLTRDPVSVLQGHQLIGVVSNVGILVWNTGVSICFFSHIIYRKSKRYFFLSRFFLWFGIFTVTLLLDDLFLLHETSSEFRIPKEILFGFYGSYLIFSIKYFWRLLGNRKAVLFWLALLFLGASVSVDTILDFSLLPLPHGPITTFIEDALKFLGIVSWTGFLVKISFQTFSQTFRVVPKQVSRKQRIEERV